MECVLGTVQVRQQETPIGYEPRILVVTPPPNNLVERYAIVLGFSVALATDSNVVVQIS